MSSQATKLFFVLLTLVAVINAAVLRAADLNPALQERSIFSFRDPKIEYKSLKGDFFNDLHSDHYDTPPPLKTFHKYPKTYFYNGKPVFEAKHGVVSQKELEKAYKRFGGVYVTRWGENPVAIGRTVEPAHRDNELALYLKNRNFVRENFGEDAALVAYGHDLKPLKVSFWDAHNPFVSSDSKVKKGASLKSMRHRLTKGGLIRVPNNAGSYLDISKSIKGNIQKVDVLGDLSYAFSKLSKVHA
ncbi:uncharacterized protein UTRI_04539 [Ustilago trichophora]|uniref:Uncharacterized protein n=1 Tax=Ustilago trichophora TaxID=86804 RepID=A0A5C3EGT5_9BASI|nr:uncharacterized protein UTRI_04539 [Ustilago trichophora]